MATEFVDDIDVPLYIKIITGTVNQTFHGNTSSGTQSARTLGQAMSAFIKCQKEVICESKAVEEIALHRTADQKEFRSEAQYKVVLAKKRVEMRDDHAAFIKLRESQCVIRSQSGLLSLRF
jgi:hypothetical protein